MPSGSLRRVVVPAADAPAEPAQLSAYELQRAARIAQNQAALAALGVKHAAAACAAPAVWRRTKPGAADGAERRAKRQAPAEAAGPARSSKRIQVRAGLAEPEPDGAGAPLPDELAEPDDVGRLLSVDEYLERNGLPKGKHTRRTRRRVRAAPRACGAASRIPAAAPSTAPPVAWAAAGALTRRTRPRQAP